MSDRLKEIVEQVNATFAENNMEKFLSFCADDIQWTMVGHKSVKGKDAIRQWMKSMGDMEPPKMALVQTLSIKQQEPKWSPNYTSRREHCFPDLWHPCSPLADACCVELTFPDLLR